MTVTAVAPKFPVKLTELLFRARVAVLVVVVIWLRSAEGVDSNAVTTVAADPPSLLLIALPSACAALMIRV